MKYLDEVRVTSDRYEKKGLKKGDVVTILLSEIRDRSFYVVLTGSDGCDILEEEVKIKDLELVESSAITDKGILEDLPGKNPEWWCKVVDGYIVNLKGDRLNKVAYDYDS